MEKVHLDDLNWWIYTLKYVEIMIFSFEIRKFQYWQSENFNAFLGGENWPVYVDVFTVIHSLHRYPLQYAC